MYIFLSVLFFFILAIIFFLRLPRFGRKPSGKRLQRIKNSPNYKDGSFKNLSHTPDLAEDTTMLKVLNDFFFKKHSGRIPKALIPAIKTDLLSLDKNKDVLVWFGHSSFFIQIDGKRILVDPVLSGSASPLPVGTRAFKGADVYTAEEIPVIDYLFISHDHWDHLDYRTIIKLKPKISRIITGLGTGEHLERWGFDENMIIEKDWNEQIILDEGFVVNTVPSRHFSGRGLKRNQALWMSFVLQTPTMKLFLGGDSGYDTHFAAIGNQFGPFDLAILENGQYDPKWKYIHLLPDQLLKAATELKAKRLFPVHNSKFALSIHPWDEPMRKAMENNKAVNMAIITPRIGEQVNLKDNTQVFEKWWESVK